jgi:hypothetical protein
MFFFFLLAMFCFFSITSLHPVPLLVAPSFSYAHHAMYVLPFSLSFLFCFVKQEHKQKQKKKCCKEKDRRIKEKEMKI